MPHRNLHAVMLTILVFMGGLFGALFARPAEAEIVHVGNIILEYGEAGDNHLRQAVAEGVFSKPDYYDMFEISRDLNAQEKQQIQQAAAYFSPITAQISPDVTARIYVGFSEDPHRSAFSYSPASELSLEGLSPNGNLYDIFMNGRPAPGYPAFLADNVIIFQYPHYSTAPTRLLLGDASFMGTMMHELGHAFGIMGSHDVDAADASRGVFAAKNFTEWNAHLYDVFGKQAKPGMNIAMDAAAGTASTPGIFQIFAQSTKDADVAAYKYPAFKGPNVDALTGGHGMPVMGGFSNAGSGLDGGNSLGHPGLMQSIMSYGFIRNMPFTEMELAAFQDMGHAFDRSLYFGKSYYYDVGGNTQINTRGFGTAAAPNTTLLGLGTHIMRDNLTLTQQADIYANGYGGGGVRIDGVNNALSIPESVRVAAGGNMGTGLLVSYGSNNRIALGGTLSATGDGGIGAHFGVRAAGAYVFSYVDSVATLLPSFSGREFHIQELHEAKRVLKEMNGPLVSDFSISGTLAGRYAAIKIESDVHVAAINLLPGARIEGDILSGWSSLGVLVSSPTDPDEFIHHAGSAGKFTDISIGSTGVRTGHISVTGDIRGRQNQENSLNIIQKGSTLHFNGQARVSTWDIKSDATLIGNSTITLYGGQALSNAGTIAPGNSIGSIVIDGAFTNTGTLAMEFDGKGATDTLFATGNFLHSGAVNLGPVPDYYNGSLNINTAAMFSGAPGSSLPTAITGFIPAASPTLSMSMLPNLSGSVTVNTTRAADAYSQYAASGNAARVGRALHTIAGVAHGDMQGMLAQLDFSAVDGSGIRAALPQLTAEPFAQAAQASAEANLGIGRLAFAHLRTAAGSPAADNARAHGPAGGDSAPQWSAFVMPLGGGSLQQSHAGVPGYRSSQAGLMGGIYRQSEGMHLNLYSAFSQRQTDVRTAAGAMARSTALHVGSSALWSKDSNGAGSGWQVWGQGQLGAENTDMRRSVAFEAYARQNDSFYTSFNGMAQLGGGYLWRADAFSFGPKLGLEYAFNSMPAISEKSGGASRLGTDAYTRHDLRGVAGITTAWSTDMGEGRFVRAHLDAVWRQDMLSGQQSLGAHFAGYKQDSFDSHVERKGEGSLGLTGGAELGLRQDVTLSALVQADVLRPGYRSVNVALALRWEF